MKNKLDTRYGKNEYDYIIYSKNIINIDFRIMI